jgi:hypothetical protein
MRVRVLLTVATLAAALMTTTGAQAAANGSASCTENGITWRADYSIAPTIYGDALTVTGLRRLQGGSDTDAGGLTWELRSDNLPSAYPPAGSAAPSYQRVRGTFSTISRPTVVYLSPRLLTPDGACVIYTVPFGGATTAAPRIGVLGDDLLHQLNDSDFNATAIQGYVEGHLGRLGVRVEVEGVTGRRWTDNSDFRGLLESDPQGFVVALGMNDALHIAAGATQAERETRANAVYGDLGTFAGEMSQRGGCVVAVTAPENASSRDPDYADAARKVNDWIRFTAAASATDSWELADFGLEARTHAAAGAEPWFTADNLTLNPAGRLVYTATLGKAAQRCSDSVVLHGKAGTLEAGLLAGKGSLPTGQAYSTRAVDGFGFEPGKGPWFSTAAGDGTIFAMNVQTAGHVFQPSGEGMSVTAFHPDSGSFSNIRFKTDRGKEVPVRPDGTKVGANLLDVATLNGGGAVVFSGSYPHNGQDPQTQGLFPAIGVMTKGANGVWRVAEGPDANGDGLPDWRNSWSPRELYDATVAADPVNGPALADRICPVNPSLGIRTECTWASELAVLPHSNDVVVAHYAPGRISVLDLTGPDALGRFGIKVNASYTLEGVDDPSWPDALSYPDPQPAGCPPPPFGAQPVPPEAERRIGIAPREVQADPSTAPGEPERFALSSDAGAYRYYVPEGTDPPQGCVRNETVSVPVVEFSYHPTAPPDQRIRVASAPFLTGEVDSAAEPLSGLRPITGGGPLHYDRQGNLWMPTGDGWSGLGVKVWAKTAQGRSFSRPECFDPAKPLGDYVTTAAGARPLWGTVCRADYNLVQPKLLGPVFNLDEDRATGNVVITSWPHATTVVVDPEGSGTAMTFRVSNLTGLMAQGVTRRTVEGPCAGDPTRRCTGGPRLAAMPGPIDASGRLWVFVMQEAPGELKRDDPEMLARALDHWAYSVDLGRLLGREPLRLTAKPGGSTTVQAEVTQTVSTTQRPGQFAVSDVESAAPLSGCWPAAPACTDPATGVDGGYALVSPPIFSEYRITVPKSGTYRLRFRAADRSANGTQARIRVTINGSSFDTAIATSGYSEVTGPALALPAGTHVVRLSAPDAASSGWHLDWMRFAR